MKAVLAANPLAPIPTDDVRACLGTDGTELNNYNWKVQWAPFEGNKFAFQNTWAEKFKNARNASDTRRSRRRSARKPCRATSAHLDGRRARRRCGRRATSTSSTTAGSSTCCGRTWGTTSSSTSTRTVWPRAAAARSLARACGPSRSTGRAVHPADPQLRRDDELLPAGRSGGDHALKAGFLALRQGALGGASAATRRSATSTVSPVRLRSTGTRSPTTISARMPRTCRMRTVGRMTLNAGVRWDRQANEALASSVPEHPFLPDWLPSVSFDGADSPVVWNDISPRVGANYDLSGTGKTVAKGRSPVIPTGSARRTRRSARSIR